MIKFFKEYKKSVAGQLKSPLAVSDLFGHNSYNTCIAFAFFVTGILMMVGCWVVFLFMSNITFKMVILISINCLGFVGHSVYNWYTRLHINHEVGELCAPDGAKFVKGFYVNDNQ